MKANYESIDNPGSFAEIEFALENPELGMMNDALAALESLRKEFAALDAVAAAVKDRETHPNDDGIKARMEIAIANLAAVREGGAK